VIGSVLLAGAASLALKAPGWSIPYFPPSVRGIDWPTDALFRWSEAIIKAATSGFQTWLGIAWLAAERPPRWATIWMLAAFSAALASRGLADGWSAHCGCLSVLWEDSVGAGIVRNLALGGLAAWAGRSATPSSSRPLATRKPPAPASAAS
jgi:hypothetical protein